MVLLAIFSDFMIENGVTGYIICRYSIADLVIVKSERKKQLKKILFICVVI